MRTTDRLPDFPTSADGPPIASALSHFAPYAGFALARSLAASDRCQSRWPAGRPRRRRSLLTECDVLAVRPGHNPETGASFRLTLGRPNPEKGTPTPRGASGRPGRTSHVNTGSGLLVSEDQCSVSDRRRSQLPQAASYLGLPEEAMSGLGHDELLARPRIGPAYPAEASAGVPAGRAGRAGLCAVGSTALMALAAPVLMPVTKGRRPRGPAGAAGIQRLQSKTRNNFP
jgi:hypothetical protein